MSVATVIGTITGFLGKYADEAEAAGSVLKGIVDALPINAQTRATLEEHIATLTTAPASIRDFLEKNADLGTGSPVDTDALNSAVAAYLKANPPKAPAVKIDKADINSAVAAYLKANPPVVQAPASGA